jgi:hypothetical protein
MWGSEHDDLVKTIIRQHDHGEFNADGNRSMEKIRLNMWRIACCNSEAAHEKTHKDTDNFLWTK